jgi:hypothetical protein
MFGWDLSRIFAIKCLLHVFPFRLLILFAMSITIILAYMIKVIEGPLFFLSMETQFYHNDFRSFSNCLWYTLITMATVGYGDYVPKTNLGRLIGVLTSFTGTMFMSLMIISIQQSLELSTMEAKTVDFVDRMTYKGNIKHKASFFFLHTFQYLVAKNKYLRELNKSNRDVEKLKKYKNELKKCMYTRISFRKKFGKMIQ